jgi:hypothetical protein
LIRLLRADTLYLCYCIDKASGDKRREEVFVAFEYDSTQTGTPGGPQSRPTLSSRRKNEETEFDAEEVEVGVGQRRGASKPLPTPQQSHRGQRTTPLSPYLDTEYEEMSTTPTAKGKGKKEAVKSAKIPEEEEDLDPFRRSVIDDEEAQIKTAARVNAVATVVGHGHVARPSLVGIGLAEQRHLPSHRRTSSGGAQKRMMTSTQELNMKSQFLMNMRPYGVEESQSSEAEMAGSAGRESTGMGDSRKDEDSLSEGEESQLGPGSDFFK